MNADQLAIHLLRNREVITYKDAYEAIVGELEGPWLNAIHVPELIDKALGSSIFTIKRGDLELRVHLDALIVSRARRKPGPGHFTGVDYTPEDWDAVFGDCSLFDSCR